MSMPINNPPSDGPVFPFSPPQNPQALPTSTSQKALQDFVQQGANEPVTDLNTTTLMNLSPESLFQVCQSTFKKDLAVSRSDSEVLYVPRGFQQLARFTFSSSVKDSKTYVPLTITTVQHSTQVDAFAAFTDKVASFQADWSTTLRTLPNRNVGNFAFETATSIFWQRWTTLVVLDYADRFNMTSPGTSQAVVPDFRTLASELDRSMKSTSGHPDQALKAGIESVNIPSVEVGKAVKCKIQFQTAAHKARSVELLQYGIVSLAGDPDPEGQFFVIGLAPGTAHLRIRVAHAESLKVTSVDSTVTATNPTSAQAA